MNLLKNRSKVITYIVDKNITNNLCISVQGREVVVQAPWYFSKNQIREIVEEKRRWILEKLKEYEIKKEEILDNGTVKILGKNCDINIRYKSIKMPKVDIEKNAINIELPNKYKKANKDELLKGLIEKIYNVIAQREIERAMEKTRIMLGFAPEDYEILRTKNVLGKCLENKKIIINPDIVKYSEDVIDYVVLHEFAHLKYKTHSKRFYEIIKEYMPKYEEIIGKISGFEY